METSLRADIRRLRDDAASSADMIHALCCECDAMRAENMVLRPKVADLEHKLALATNPSLAKADTEFLPTIAKVTP